MRVTTDVESRKASMLKAYRAAIRLKYSLLADEESRRVLPQLEARIDNAIQTGQPLELNPAEAFDEVDA
jgi:hypothetical protein